MVLSRTRLLLSVMVLAVVCGLAHAEKPNNPYGIMLMSGGEDATDGMLLHFKLARNFCGEWGYVRTGSAVDPSAVRDYLRTYAGLRAVRLIPVCTAYQPPQSYYEPDNRDLPRRDPDGSFTTFGRAFEDWARALYAKGITIPYFEFGNEVNGGFIGEHPEVYAEMCIAVSKALHRVDPAISFGTGGMTGCGDEFYDRMLQKAPEAAKYIDHWGLHPYAANHPPGYAEFLGDYGVESHLWTAKALAKHGVTNPVFIMTETGYELGNEKDKNYPKITEENRAEYLVAAFKKCWEPDPRVRGVMPFMLQDVKWSGWDGWDFVREDYSHTPMYDAIAALPKPKGSDFLPSGPSSVRGKITDADLGRGIADMIVWLWRPNRGGYAALTDSQGCYEIEDIPEADYNITAFRDGFESAPEVSITLNGGEPATWNAVVKRTGYLVLADGKPGSACAPGWTPANKRSVYAVDFDVKRSGSSSQRIEADGMDNAVWNISNYISCLPDREYSAEVWVKTQSLRTAGKSGASLTLEMTDSFARPLGAAKVALEKEGDNDWTPLQVVFKTPAKARRMRVSLMCEAESGRAWFDDVFLHEGSWPLPSTYALEKSGTGKTQSIRGTVFGPGGAGRLQGATVCAIPTGKWSSTDYLGRYEIEGLREGKYRVVAVHPSYSSGAANCEAGESDRSIHMAQMPAPAQLQNAGFEEIPSNPTWFGGWQRYGTVEGVVSNGWHKGLIPEAFPEGFTSHSGKGFYGAVAGSNIKDGMIYQTMSVEPDALYEVSVWSMTYQTDDGNRGDVANRLGVDPMGGRDPKSPYVIWSPIRPSHGKWTQIKLRVRPTGNRLTVYLHHLQVQGLTFNCNFFDDCKVEKVSSPAKTYWSDD